MDSSELVQTGDRDAQFQSFTLEDWTNWLNALLAGNPKPPLLTLGRDESLLDGLINLYTGLPGKSERDTFAEAVKSIYRSTQRIPENREQLYYLLHLMAYTIPLGAADLLRQRLNESVLKDMEYAGHNLQTLLLIANSKYEVDSDLVDYIYRTARVSNDLRHLLACLRILGLRGGQEAFPFINYVLPLISSEPSSAKLARQLHGMTRRIGYQHLLEWYLENSEDLAREWPRQWEFFEWGLRERLLTDTTLQVVCKSDPNAGFLTGFVQANANNLLPSTVLYIARLYKLAGQERTINCLFEIWRRGNQKWYTEPWVFLTQAQTHEKNCAAITNGRKRPDYKEVFFDSSKEKELEEILLEVRNRYDSLVVPIRMGATA